ncbi:MAG: GNAT family N-acetyltransferase [Planctomycetota bacterium]
MDEAPRCCLHTDLPDDLALAIGELKAKTWPRPGVDGAKRAERFREVIARDPGRAELASRSFVLMDGPRVIAHAALEPRRLTTDAGPLWVMGLGGVCSAPGLRGQGLGKRVVQAALAVIDQGLAPFSLFQTSHAVQPFYEKLGACLVDNPLIDSTAEDPAANPFWDDVAMRYPAGPGWPAGQIDLNGPGY